MFFAWAGAATRGVPHYFRVHTDNYLIEAVNSVGGANHIHTVIRDFDNDFGHDLVANHGGVDTNWGSTHLDSRTQSSADADPGIER